jgi:hypothetical protein
LTAGFLGAGFAGTLAPALEEVVVFLEGGEPSSLSSSLLRLMTGLVARFLAMVVLGVVGVVDGCVSVIGSTAEPRLAGTSPTRVERPSFVGEPGVLGKSWVGLPEAGGAVDSGDDDGTVDKGDESVVACDMAAAALVGVCKGLTTCFGDIWAS